MATAVDCGADRLRDIRGECCDLCGDVCHPDAEICVAISCGRCEPLLYHQGCIEKYLKKHGFEMNRKTGFPCPRGRGKATRFPDECKGRVDKSHPIIPRNEEKKKKSLAPPINEVMAKQVKQKPDPKAKQQQQAKPPAIPRKAKPIAQQAATVLRSGAPLRTATPPAGNVWQQAGASSAVRQAPTAEDHAAASAAALAAAAELEKPKGPHVPVGLVLEEALTKAQKKNLQRRKKKQQQDAAGGDACSESGTAITDASSVDGWNDGAGSSSNAGSSLGTTAGAAALLSSNSFVTDIKRYQQLLGLYVGGDDSDDEDAELSEDVGDDSASDVSSAAAPAALTRPSSSLSNASTPAALPDAGSSGEHAAAAAASDADDAELAAIMEQSRREYELQQEMQRQRDILSGYGAGSAFASSAATTEQLLKQPASPPPVVLPAFSVPIAQPFVVPAAVPVAVPVAEPVPTLGSFAGLGFQQQPAQPLWQQQAAVKSSTLNNAAGFGGYGVQQAAAFGMVPMAAGHGMATAAAAGGEEDDDLDSLLALCGVAG